jgi:hypothetical protein
MSGQRALTIALNLADQTAATLADRGVPDFLMPSYADLVRAMWPVAESLAWSAKHDRRCRKLRKQSRRVRKGAAAAAAQALEGAAAQYAQAAREARPRVADMVPFDPRDVRHEVFGRPARAMEAF